MLYELLHLQNDKHVFEQTSSYMRGGLAAALAAISFDNKALSCGKVVIVIL